MSRKKEVVVYVVAVLMVIGSLSVWWRLRGSSAETGVMPQPEVQPSIPPEPRVIFVYVTGAVKTSGVYQMKEGQRVFELLERAVTEPDADLESLNLAALLKDGQKIHVPRKGESGHTDSPSESAVEFSKININQATQQELESLPGIGQSLAKAILDFRAKYGPFQKAEDIKKVPGIGDKIYSRISPYITVY